MIELEKYEIVEEIGRGGVATVYRARHKVLQTEVAIKVLHNELAHDREFVKRFINGAKNAARLKHSSIIPVYDVGEEQGSYYIVMECLRGETLKDHIEKHGPVPEPEIARIIKAVALGLDYAHANGVVHRDIKSPNLFMKETGEVVLMDFDIAKASDVTQSLTQDGSVLGTPAYMSPEQARGEPADSKSDIYSLGIVMYEMATGELPFKGENTLSILRQIAMDTPTPPCAINPRISKELQKAILWCMEKTPANRPSSAFEIFSNAPPASEAPKSAAGEAESGKREEGARRRRWRIDWARKPLVKVAIWIVVLGAAYIGFRLFWPVLEIRDYNIVSFFTPGRSYSGLLPPPSMKAQKLDPLVAARVKKLYGEAVQQIKAGNIDGGLEKLETIRNIDPGNRLAHRGMQKAYAWHVRKANASFKSGDLKSYRRFMDKAVAYFPAMARDNLYQRGQRYADSGRLLTDDADNASAVYAHITRTFPQDKSATRHLLETLGKAMAKSFEDRTFTQQSERAERLAASLPDLSAAIFTLCGDAYYTNNVLLTSDRHNAASLYTRALAADGANDHAKRQLLLIVDELRNRLAGIGNRTEKRSLLESARANFPDTDEFRAILADLESKSR